MPQTTDLPANTSEGGDFYTRLAAEIVQLDRAALVEQFRRIEANFPIDFTDAWFEGQSDDQLRHVFLALCLHCREVPDFRRAA